MERKLIILKIAIKIKELLSTRNVVIVINVAMAINLPSRWLNFFLKFLDRLRILAERPERKIKLPPFSWAVRSPTPDVTDCISMKPK